MLYRCNCSGKCKMLGVLEQKIMEILWKSEQPLATDNVLSKLNDNSRYTTIMTVLKRMYNKGILKRELKSKTYFYYPTVDKKTYASECLPNVFSRIINDYGEYSIEIFKKITSSS